MYVILYVRSIVFIINAAFLYINWARLIALYPVIYYLTVQVCAGISQHFPFVTHRDNYGTSTVIHNRDGSEVAAFISVKAAITKFVIWWEGK